MACEFLGVRQVVPMHWGTFPLLTGTPTALKTLVEPRGVQVLELKPGEIGLPFSALLRRTFSKYRTRCASLRC